MAGYNPELDKVLWSTEKKDFKPKATVCAQIKSYNGGEPKVMLVEEGEGYSGKAYTGALLKRVAIEDLELVLGLLNEAKPILEQASEDHANHKSKLKS